MFRKIIKTLNFPGVSNYSSKSRNFQEVRIPTNGGYLAGKWYGPLDKRPLVGYHGNNNNAGTFDKLADLMPPEISFLSLEAHGHGHSSRYPQGSNYHGLDLVQRTPLLLKYFKWDKISFLAHSAGGVIAFLSAGLYPEHVDLVINIDGLKYPVTQAKEWYKSMKYRLQCIMNETTERKHTSYTYDECIDRIFKGNLGSITRENCKYILNRLIEKCPDKEDNYILNIDYRLKYFFIDELPQRYNFYLANKIKIPFQFLQSTGYGYIEEPKDHDEILEFLLKNNPNFEHHLLEGSHHVHINEAEKVSKIVNPFLLKHFKIEDSIVRNEILGEK